MSKIKLAHIDDIIDGEMIQVTKDYKSYLIAKINNKIYVTSDMCTHEDAELTMGCLDGTKVKCPLHGSYFDLISGKALNEPAEESIITYKNCIEKGQIFIDD